MQGEMPAARVYSPVARTLHWITVAAVFVMIPVGLTMSYRGNVLNIWDGLTNGLYSAHKLTGFLLLWLMAQSEGFLPREARHAMWSVHIVGGGALIPPMSRGWAGGSARRRPCLR